MDVYIDNVQIPRPPYLGGGQWSLTGLTGITLLFGKNSAGKSLLLRGWRERDVENTHYVTPERGGEISYNPGHIQHQQNPTGRRGQTENNFAPTYREQVVARISAYFQVRGDQRGSDLRGDPSEIERLLALLIPDFTVEISATATPPFDLTRASDGQHVSNVSELSSGEAQILTLGLDVLTIAGIWDIEQKPTRLLLLDEPDAHLHPDLQARLADFLCEIGRRFKLQMVIATHSTTLLAALGQFGGNDSSVVYLDRTKSDFTPRRFDAVMKEVAACLGGNVLMGPLFGATLLLVEGDDDYRIWSQVPRHHKVTLAVIPSNGDEIRKYQLTLERIFGSLADEPTAPFGIALLDGDKPIPTPNPDNPQKYVRYVGMACHEAENLYVTDEVLADLDLSWDAAAQRIEQEAQHYGNKRPILAGASTWNRQDVNLKEVINQIAQILDPKNVHWTFRVGRVIGRNRPAGQLATFLGDDVVTAIWGACPNVTQPEQQ